MALVRSDAFRDVDRLFQQLWAGEQRGPRSMTMPMDAYRKEDSFLLQLDLPGVVPDSVDLTIEDDMLTIRAERPAPHSDGSEPVISERPYGTFARQVLLGNNLDTEHVHADYERGVLTVVLPVAERAKPRRIEVKTQAEVTSPSTLEKETPSVPEKHTSGLLHRHKGQKSHREA